MAACPSSTPASGACAERGRRERPGAPALATIRAGMTVTPDASEVFDPVVRRFHDLYCKTGWRTWSKTEWMGVPLIKCPFDLLVYQEILFERRPDVIVETGTYRGGSAYFFASMCDLIGSGRVITIDIA